jgi:hypothetical protein
MKALQFSVLGALLFTAGGFEVSGAQVSSPYAQALDRAKAANELRVLRQNSSLPKATSCWHSRPTSKSG